LSPSCEPTIAMVWLEIKAARVRDRAASAGFTLRMAAHAEVDAASEPPVDGAILACEAQAIMVRGLTLSSEPGATTSVATEATSPGSFVSTNRLETQTSDCIATESETPEVASLVALSSGAVPCGLSTLSYAQSAKPALAYNDVRSSIAGQRTAAGVAAASLPCAELCSGSCRSATRGALGRNIARTRRFAYRRVAAATRTW
jgi:hypothetical protein